MSNNNYIIENKRNVCNVCNKKYCNITSLYNHIKNCHSNIYYKCIHCSKSYTIYSSFKKHEKKCIETKKVEDNIQNLIEIEKVKLMAIEKKIESAELNMQIEKVKLTAIEKTIESAELNMQIEKQKEKNILLKSKNKNIKISSNNIIINNNIIYSFGSKEDKDEQIKVLDNITKINLLSGPYFNQLIEYIKLIYCNKYSKIQNILITNMRDKYAYVYENNCFVKRSKEEILEIIMGNGIITLDEFRDDIDDETISAEKIKKINEQQTKFTNSYENIDDNYYDGTIKYANFKDYNKQKITLLFFNIKDIVKKRVQLMMSNTDLSNDALNEIIQNKETIEYTDYL